ncbi:hypothetical protein MKZ38_007538 [Zalerion maritima]|uniref:Uncharacterized protein n=1 Tax=Zalerion maritima TaxID=339359 RepID=A0AAD5RIN2_9PEZI|nr:hypothetical protein MKZ38_007538 [Zalerion maritima]
MKLALFLTALIAGAMAAPAAPAPELVEVDPSDFEALLATTSPSEARDLEKRASCPSQQACVGHVCTTLVCMEAGLTSYCVVYKYGPC